METHLCTSSRKFMLPALFLALCLLAGSTVSASSLVSQTWLPGNNIPQFESTLPVFGPAGSIPRVNAYSHPNLTVTMKEIEQQVMPASTGLGPTRVWAYEIRDTQTGAVLGPAHWPAVTVDAQRLSPTTVTYVNQLPSFGDPITINGVSTTATVQGLVTVDKTIHWSDPLNSPAMNPCMDNPLAVNCGTPYTGPVPAVAHLHGGEVPSTIDGGPEAWFTPAGQTGPGYFTLGTPGPGKAVYKYLNTQEPGTLWFHDHALGMTRTNVYGGMAAFYFVREPTREPAKLPSGKYEIELAIQDRQFDTTGQLYFPDGSDALCGSGLVGDPCLNGGPPNPDTHPFWNPEFIGDVAIVNGAPWPTFNVEPRRYRFRLLDGSNARMYTLKFGDLARHETAPPVYVIGSDDNYIDAPVRVNSVFIAPGERSDIIVDFGGLAGKQVTVTNSASIPYPNGLVPGSAGQEKMGQIMRFNVVQPSYTLMDTSCNPANGGCKRPVSMVRLTDGRGNLKATTRIDKVRQLVLKEQEGAGGPVKVFVNNTGWDGTASAGIAAVFPDGISEKPKVGATELWEIINLTIDAHPIHTHLSQFQILNREDYDTNAYPAVWEAAFGTGPTPLPAGCTAGVSCPGYGPPLPYNTANDDGALGGNPAVGPYLMGNISPPNPEESGWKDTVKVYPGQVTRMVVRWAPTDRVNSSPGINLYPFDPTQGPGYVWHCHIIDHEDNEMMRPYKVTR